MKATSKFIDTRPLIIAALHLPPFLASGHPDAKRMPDIVDNALRNAERAVNTGVPALYLQDLGDYPWGQGIQPHTVAALSVVGSAVRREFPDLFLGICTMCNGGRQPLAIAQAIDAQFVRLKVYIGAMVRAEGVVQGCAYEAVSYRSQIGAGDIAILADIYDRTGEPLGRLSLKDAATQAAVFGRADGLILTGHSFDGSLDMLSEIGAAELGVPLLIGGGTNSANVDQALAHADGVIVSSAFKPVGGWTHAGMSEDWDENQIVEFMGAVGRVYPSKVRMQK